MQIKIEQHSAFLKKKIIFFLKKKKRMRYLCIGIYKEIAQAEQMRRQQ